MRRRPSADMLLLFALLAVFAAAALNIATRSRPPADDKTPKRSVASPMPGGWKGLYLLLQERGARVMRVERAPSDWPQDAAVMVCAEAFTTGSKQDITLWKKEEAEAARRWLRQGRTLIVLSGRRSALLDSLGLPVAAIGPADATLFPLQPAPFLSGVSGVTIPGRSRFRETPRDAMALLADSDTAAVVMRRGGGNLIAISDSSLADNSHLTRADNARFLTAMIETYAGKGGGIGFDEYHQGYRTQDSFWDAVGSAGRWTALQVVLLMLVIAWSASRRFGMPRPLPEASRVSSEYVASLAALYRRARAGDAAVESIYGAFRRDMCRAAGLASDATNEELIPRVARLAGTADAASLQQRLESLVRRSDEAIGSGTIPERDLVPLVREMEALRKELRLGGNDGADPRR